MRTILIGFMLGCPAVGMVLAWIGARSIKMYLASIPTLRSAEDLERYKRVVKQQMYFALILIPLLFVPAVLYGYGYCKKAMVLSDVLYVLVPSLVMIGVGQLYKPVERSFKTIPAEDESLAAERDRIVDTWLHRMLPDW